MFKKLWRNSVCITPPPDESNNVLQMKTRFKKINPRNKLGVNTNSCYNYKSNYDYNNYQKPRRSRENYKIPHPPGKINIIC